jgi:hypothetical protein
MSAICASPIKGTIARLTIVDTCGVPVTGSSSKQITTAGFIQVQMAPQYEDGEEFIQRTADGALCVNEKDAPFLKRMQNTVDFCQVDPDLPTLISNARRITSSPPASGTGFAWKTGAQTVHFSLEVWQRVAGSGACDPSGAQRYIYHAWPNMGNAQLGQYTIQNGTSTLQVLFDSFNTSLLWTLGNSWLDGPPQDALEHWLFNITTTPPPTPACGFLTI